MRGRGTRAQEAWTRNRAGFRNADARGARDGSERRHAEKVVASGGILHTSELTAKKKPRGSLGLHAAAHSASRARGASSSGRGSMSGALGVAGTLAGRQARAPLQLGTRVFDARDTQSHTNNLISRLTTPRPLRSSPPSQRQAARVFLERSPFVPWAQQRPAFVHPAFTGVVHPDLPLWSGVSDPPPEPRPESRSSLPRVARLTTLEARDQPCFHVQTISAARCLSEDDARRKIIAAATHGAAALLLVSGDALADADARRARPSTRPRPRPRESSTSSLDSLALLSVASRARSAGDIPPDTILGCVANPSLDGADGVARLDAKISAGAGDVRDDATVSVAVASSRVARRRRRRTSPRRVCARAGGTHRHVSCGGRVLAPARGGRGPPRGDRGTRRVPTRRRIIWTPRRFARGSSSARNSPRRRLSRTAATREVGACT